MPAKQALFFLKPVGLVSAGLGNHAQELHRLAALVFVPVRGVGRDKDRLASGNFLHLVTDADLHATRENELLVFDGGVFVLGDAPPRHDGELTGNEVGNTVFGADENLDKSFVSPVYRPELYR